MGNDDSLAEEIATVAEDLLSILPTDPADVTNDVRKEMDDYADSLEELMERIEFGSDWAGVVVLFIVAKRYRKVQANSCLIKVHYTTNTGAY